MDNQEGVVRLDISQINSENLEMLPKEQKAELTSIFKKSSQMGRTVRVFEKNGKERDATALEIANFSVRLLKGEWIKREEIVDIKFAYDQSVKKLKEKQKSKANSISGIFKRLFKEKKSENQFSEEVKEADKVIAKAFATAITKVSEKRVLVVTPSEQKIKGLLQPVLIPLQTLFAEHKIRFDPDLRHYPDYAKYYCTLFQVGIDAIDRLRIKYAANPGLLEKVEDKIYSALDEIIKKMVEIIKNVTEEEKQGDPNINAMHVLLRSIPFLTASIGPQRSPVSSKTQSPISTQEKASPIKESPLESDSQTSYGISSSGTSSTHSTPLSVGKNIEK